MKSYANHTKWGNCRCFIETTKMWRMHSMCFRPKNMPTLRIPSIATTQIFRSKSLAMRKINTNHHTNHTINLTTNHLIEYQAFQLQQSILFSLIFHMRIVWWNSLKSLPVTFPGIDPWIQKTFKNSPICENLCYLFECFMRSFLSVCFHSNFQSIHHRNISILFLLLVLPKMWRKNENPIQNMRFRGKTTTILSIQRLKSVASMNWRH